MTLEDVLDHRVATAEQVVAAHLLGHVPAERILPAGRDALLAKAADVPDPHGLIQRRGHHEILLDVEGGAHDVVVVAGQDADAAAGLPVPDPNGLVVGRGDDPRVLLVELHRADVIQVPQQGVEAPAQLVVPNLNLVVVTWVGRGETSSASAACEQSRESDVGSYGDREAAARAWKEKILKSDSLFAEADVGFFWALGVAPILGAVGRDRPGSGRDDEGFSPPDTNSGWELWKLTPRTGPSCSSKRSIRVPMR